MSSDNCIPFTKMHGVGNDYIYIDCFRDTTPSNPSALAIAMSHRHFGVGGDGLVLVRPANDLADGSISGDGSNDQAVDAWMQMFNADGSESEMCGNAIRCVAKLLFDRGYVTKSTMMIHTGAGNLMVRLNLIRNDVGGIRVDMGQPILKPKSVPTLLGKDHDAAINEVLEVDGRSFEVTCVSMGNPHCVIYVDRATDELVNGIGPQIENHVAFPNRVNIEFVEIRDKGHVRQRTWERGSGETWACGTGAAAVCVAGVITERTQRQIDVELLGGHLQLEYDEATGHVYKTGPATEVFQGVWKSAAIDSYESR